MYGEDDIMKKFVNGEYIEMTPEEIEELEEQAKNFVKLPQVPTSSQRISALESAITDLAVMLMEVQ